MAKLSGPDRALVCVITCGESRKGLIAQAMRGFIVPERFEDDKPLYEKPYVDAGRNGITEYEIPFTALPR
ncbi:hypothetical protein SOASR015_33390 [Pectobacterium carotovorum subsp. carotovorum]|nr:hypothetical protein SOASR015_33390 [Pectobacterium carotovorum subsp. carotovorum]GLX58228.1 hypothetical protein Pcaca02_35370 [Pectobacterium carotovorum subsp. carotovorum]